MPDKPKGPTTEVGHSTAIQTDMGGLLPWSVFVDDREQTPEVTWPTSVETFRQMQTDAQVKGLLMATTLPIRRFRWEIDPAGAKPEVVEHIAESLNLPIRGQEPIPKRQRGRFNHDKHMAHAFRALAYGHFYFEQVGYIGDDGLWHLKKLATRPPRSITNLKIAPDGSLEFIEQAYGLATSGIAAPLTGVKLPISRLLAYIWEPEDDADWVGRSMLRSCYANWLIKERLLRVDATKHERNAMGIPWFEVDRNTPDKRIEELAQIAERIRVSEQGGGAGPGKLRIAGVEGALPDTIGSVRYHDEQMSKEFLVLFFNLGTTETGSRALGSEFIDWYVQGQDAIADWYRDTTQAYQVEDDVEINWGPDEQPPQLVYTRLESERLAVADLVKAVEVGLVAVTEETRVALAQRWGLPPPPKGQAAPPPPPPEARGRRSRRGSWRQRQSA